VYRLVRFLGALCLSTSLGLALNLLFPGASLAVNVNAATQEQLQTVRGIGPKTAQSIIDERLRGGAYESFEDLSDRVKGIGPKTAQSLQSAGLTVGAGTGAR
jgi:competence protein ComEA